jgi:CheY-like chemotaxis protein
MTNTDNRTLLLVEDNPDDIFLMRRALKKSGLELSLQIVTDGKQALEYLGGVGLYEDRGQYPRPDCVFLDLKLPYLNGFEVLEWLRRDPENKDLDVVILTSSPEERDMKIAEKLGAKAYLVKPPTVKALLDVFLPQRPVTAAIPQYAMLSEA